MNTIGNKRRKILIVSKDLNSSGGVVSVVSMLMSHFSKAIDCTHFRIGPKASGHKRWFAFFYPIIDCIRLVHSVLFNHYDVVCLNSSLSVYTILRDGLFLVSLSLIRYNNTYMYIHGWDTYLEDRIKKNRFYRYCFKYLFIKSSRLFVLASNFKNALVQIGFPDEKIYVLTTMFESNSFDKFKFVKSRTISGTLLFMSRFQYQKGGLETIEAFNLLYTKYPQIKLIMAGDGPETDSLKRYTRHNGIVDRVEFTGYVRGQDKIKFLSEADIFVFPTYYREGCPVTLLEAMAAGLAVVTTRVGAIPDIITEGENGILLKDTKPSTIAKAIESLFNNKKELLLIKQRNHRKAYDKYEAKEVTKIVEDLFLKN